MLSWPHQDGLPVGVEDTYVAPQDCWQCGHQLATAPDEEAQVHIRFLWRCYRAALALPRMALPAHYTFKRWFTEHTQSTDISAEYIERVEECAWEIAAIAQEHGCQLEIGWLVELMLPGEFVWIDSWNRDQSAELVNILEKPVEDMQRMVLCDRPADRGALPPAGKLDDGQPTLSTTIAHLYCLSAVLAKLKARISFVNMSGVSDVREGANGGMQEPGQEGFDLFGACSRQLCEIPLLQHRCLAIIASTTVAKLMAPMLEPMPTELVYAASKHSSYVPDQTPDALIKMQLCRLVTPLYLCADNGGGYRMAIGLNHHSGIPYSGKDDGCHDLLAFHNSLMVNFAKYAHCGARAAGGFDKSHYNLFIAHDTTAVNALIQSQEPGAPRWFPGCFRGGHSIKDSTLARLADQQGWPQGVAGQYVAENGAGAAKAIMHLNPKTVKRCAAQLGMTIDHVVEEMRNGDVAPLKSRMDLKATTIAEAAKQRGVSALVIEHEIAEHGKQSVVSQMDLRQATVEKAAKQRGVEVSVIEQEIAEHGKQSVVSQMDLKQATVEKAAKQRGVEVSVIEQEVAKHGKKSAIARGGRPLKLRRVMCTFCRVNEKGINAKKCWKCCGN